MLRSFLSRFLCLLCWTACCNWLAGQEIMRMVLLRMPPPEMAAVVTQLAGKNEDAMVPVLKRKGISSWADLTQADPWDSEVHMLKKEAGSLVVKGENAMDFGVEFEFEAGGTDHFHIRAATGIYLPAIAKGYRHMRYSMADDIRAEENGLWREVVRWNDGKEAVMLWIYPLSAKIRAGGKSDGLVRNVRIELAFLKAESGDVGTLALGKPESREKAFQWIRARAVLHREAAFRCRARDKVVWRDEAGKIDNDRPDVINDLSALSIEASFSGSADDLEATCVVMVQKKDGKLESHKVPVSKVSGVWEFTEIKGMSEANLVAVRMVWP